MNYSKNSFDIRKNYTLILEFSLIISLLILIAVMKFQFPVNNSSSAMEVIDDEPPIVMAPVTIQEKKPPPPVLARIPAEIPNDDPIEPPPIKFGDIFDDASPLPLPPEPEKNEEKEIFDNVELMPQIKGGIQALYNHITYPDHAKRIGIQGRVVVQFVVNEQGEVEQAEIIRGIGGGCDEVVLKAIKLQSYTPGIQNGRFVKVRMQQVIYFRLQN